jgi:leucyl/phenylalanyl-tRNA---protein transferase
LPHACAGTSEEADKVISKQLTPELLVRAYSMGIFPMGDSRNPGAPLRWYAPDPRCIFDLEAFHVPKRLHRTYRSGKFQVKVNSAWREVMMACADREDTWITDEIYDAYTELHRMGLAHSVETYLNGSLAGGLYGVCIGGAFMGESMFHTETDASKIALLFLVERMKERGFALLDCQFITSHLNTFGAVEISHDEYLKRLNMAIALPCRFD